eukprot:Skav210909  [mRNA]  locus=scaffold15:130393:132312:+ [translate_table: standard]
MDQALAEVGPKQLNVQKLQVATSGHVDCPEPISLDTFTSDACRPLSKSIKSIALLFDVHLGIPSCGDAAVLGEIAAKEQYDDLPPPIAFQAKVPESSKVELFICDLGNGQVNIMKALYMGRAVNFQVANSVVSGAGFVPVHRPGPWAVKKAVQWLLSKLGGHQVRWHSLQEKSAGSVVATPKWNPSNQELEEGVDFINAHAPECDARNEQTLWILINTKADSGTPIAGWPEGKARFMAQNKSKGLSGALSMTEFPLTTMSLKPFLRETLLPLIYPLLLNYGIMLLGSPGVEKTPFVIVLAMALGRYHIRRAGCEGLKPGWRRAKSLDNFRHRVPVVHEGLFLDDPCRAKVNIADLKSFMTTDEDGTVDPRYNDSRLARNQMRAFASNDLPQERFECKPGASSISEDDFFSLLSDIFQGDREKDVLAVLKRSILFLFGNNALYLRLPSERKDAIVHRIDVEAVHQDLLADRDKPLYGKYKGGVMETGPTFDADVQKEQDMIEKGVASMIEHDQIQTYVELANGKLQDKLLFHGATFLPASAASSNSEDPGSPMQVCPPVPPIGTTPCGRRQKKFVYPERRLRAKTSPTQELEQLAQDAEAADEGLKDEETAAEPMDVEEPVSMDLEADEEAASHMGLTGF